MNRVTTVEWYNRTCTDRSDKRATWQVTICPRVQHVLLLCTHFCKAHNTLNTILGGMGNSAVIGFDGLDLGVYNSSRKERENVGNFV